MAVVENEKGDLKLTDFEYMYMCTVLLKNNKSTTIIIHGLLTVKFE